MADGETVPADAETSFETNAETGAVVTVVVSAVVSAVVVGEPSTRPRPEVGYAIIEIKCVP